jgi:hypothetical protein
MNMKHSSVYRRQGNWYIVSSSLTSDGVWLNSGSVSKVSDTADPAHKGQLILAALRGSKEGVPHPVDFELATAAVLEVIGCRSWSELECQAQTVTVQFDGNEFVLTPWKRGKKTGWVPAFGEHRLLLPVDSVAELLGLEAERTFAFCE